MKLRLEAWTENLYDYAESRIKLAVENRSQILQILCSLAVFIISASSLQYVPFLVGWFHVNDLVFGKVLVYSLPLWIFFAAFLICIS